MNMDIPNVIIILDPVFGERLQAFLAIAPIWIADTKINRATFENLRNHNKKLDHREKGSITSFTISDTPNYIKDLLNIMPSIETHYGQIENNQLIFPNGFFIKVIGASLSKDAIDVLQSYGLTSFIETLDGFEMRKA